MKKLILLYLTLLPLSTFAQNESSIDFVVGTSYDYRHLYAPDEGEQMINKLIINNRKAEVGNIGLRIGVDYSKKLSQRFSIKTGLRLVKTGYKSRKIDFSNAQWGTQHNGQGGFDPNASSDPLLDGLTYIQYHYNDLFIEVPIRGRIDILPTKKAHPYIEIGVSPQILFYDYTKHVTNQDSKRVGVTDELLTTNIFQLATSFSFGFLYSHNDKYDIFAQSIARFHLTKLYDAPIHEYLYNIGIEMGVRKKL